MKLFSYIYIVIKNKKFFEIMGGIEVLTGIVDVDTWPKNTYAEGYKAFDQVDGPQ